MSPKNSSSAFCLIFSSSDFLALFSKPEYVWTTYHFLSILLVSAAVMVISKGRVLDLVGQELPEHVEHAEQEGSDDAGDDHGDGGRPGLGEAGPRHLAQLDGDLHRDVVGLRSQPEIDCRACRGAKTDHRGPGP